MMNHDYAHCWDYEKGVCPEECFRAKITEDRKNYPYPVTYAKFKDTDACPLTNPQPKRTHGDRLRSMTDEELAEFMGTLPCCPPGVDVEELCYPLDSCEGTDLQVKCWLKWLRQEADT